MGYLTIEDMYGNVEVVVFPDLFQEAQDMLLPDAPVVLSGHTDRTDKGLKVIARKIASIDNDEQITELKNYKPASPNGNGRRYSSGQRYNNGQGTAEKEEMKRPPAPQ